MEKLYRPTTLLSENSKTGRSINLPILHHCVPTKNCAACCYAKHGHTIRPSNLKKQNWISEYLKGDDISGMIKETRKFSAVRVSATGDLLMEHVPNMIRLAKECHQTMLWGMTRKLDIADAVNGHLPNLKLMVSVDSSSPDSVWNYQGALCYGPRVVGDTVPRDSRIKVVFPYHFHGKAIKALTKGPKDCRAIWKEIKGCSECGRCWKW